MVLRSGIVLLISLFMAHASHAQENCERARIDNMKAFNEMCVSDCSDPSRICIIVDRVTSQRWVESWGAWTGFYCWHHTVDNGVASESAYWGREGAIPECEGTQSPPADPAGVPGSGGGASSSTSTSSNSAGGSCPSNPGANGSNKVKNSIINIEKRSLGEVVSLTGANFGLFYNSADQDGREVDFKIKVPLTGATPRDLITSYTVEIQRGTTTLDTATYSNIANQSHTYIWNGLDSLGNPVDVENFVAVVKETSPDGTFPYTYPIRVGHWNVKKLGLGGWAPTILTKYSPAIKRLYYANGDYRNVTAKAYGASQLYIASDDGSQVYIFDTSGNHLYTKTGLLGTTVYTFNYDGAGKLTSIAEPFGKTTYFNRDFSGNLVSVTAPNSQTTTVTLDANGYVASITNPNFESYSMTYYGTKGLMNTFTKPNGEVSTFYFDSEGFLTKDAHSGGFFYELVNNLSSGYNITTITPLGRQVNYNSAGLTNGSKQEVTYPNGEVTRSTFSISGSNYTKEDDFGWYGINTSSSDSSRFGDTSKSVSQMSVIVRNSGSTTYDVSESVTLADPNDPFSITSLSKRFGVNGTNTATTTSFDPATKKFTSTTYLGKTRESTIDNYERVVSAKKGNLNSVGINYTNENITSITQGTRTTAIGYNTAGLISTITNPLSQTTSYVYDSANRVASKIFPDSRTVTYGYDGVGNLTSVTPPGKPVHNFGLNAHGLVGAYQPPALTGVSVVNTNYTYNLDKQLTNITRPDGKYISFNYNSASGLLETVDTAAGTYNYAFDTWSTMYTSISTPDNISLVLGYAGKQIYQANTQIAGNSVSLYYKSFSGYDLMASDSVVNSSGSTTSTINYLYNDDRELSKAGDVNITYHVPNGYITGTTMGSGTTGFTDTYTYNTYGEVTGYQAKRGTTVLYDLVLTRDGSGRIAGKTQTMNSTTNDYVYGFDSSGRLQQVTKNAVVVSNYGYDPNSNRNSGNVGAQTTTATYDDQDRLLSYNTLSFTYNANGDLLTKTNSATAQTTTYTYDVFGNLTKVVLPGGTTTINYEIDGLNRRVGKKVGTTVQRRFVYMDQYRIAAELNSSGTITKRFIYGSKKNIPDYMIASGVKYRIISDQLGSPRLVVNQSTGAITQRMDHDEYGRVIEDTNPGFIPFGFGGGVYDYQTGIVRFGARDYDPEYARWTSKDPILFRGRMANLYGYVFNDPINFIDPKGKDGEIWDYSNMMGVVEKEGTSGVKQISIVIPTVTTAVAVGAAACYAAPQLPSYCVANFGSCSDIILSTVGTAVESSNGVSLNMDQGFWGSVINAIVSGIDRYQETK